MRSVAPRRIEYLLIDEIVPADVNPRDPASV